MTSTVAERADEVGREVRQRRRIYPDWIKRGRIRFETAARKEEVMADAERTLRFLAQHAPALRGLCQFLINSGATPLPTDAERDALLAHPGVAALLEVWPDAELHILGPIRPPATPDQNDLFDQENNAA